MTGIVMALLAGLIMSVQGVFNTRLKEASGIWLSNGWVHFSGFVFCLLMWLIFERVGFTKLFQVENKMYLLGGVLGAFIVYTVIVSISELGPAGAIMIILISQMIVAYLIEVFGLFGSDKVGFELNKLIGVAFMLVGIIVFQR